VTRIDSFAPVALLHVDLWPIQLGIEVAGLGIGLFPTSLGHFADFVVSGAICWGNEWGNMPHGFQPIST
jgi:hypothetical protein